MKQMQENPPKKLKLSVFLYSALIAVAVYIIVIGVMIYGFNANNKVVKITARVIPYPAVIIDYFHFITIKELDENLQAIKKFYENQDFSKVGLRVDFSTEEGGKRLKIKEKGLLNKMIEDEAVEILSRREGIRINKQIIAQSVDQKLAEYGSGEEVEERLKKLYGWTMRDFEEKIVKPGMYREELMRNVVSREPENSQAKEKIKQAKEELKNKANFQEVAQKYSEGLTAQDGGELGWFKKDQLISEVSKAVFSLKEGETSDIIESELGFHIVELEEKKTEGNEEMARIRQIFISKNSLAKWLEGKMKNIKVFVLLKDYYWDKQNLAVEFRNDNLKKFENMMLSSFQNDASLLFNK